MIKKTIKWNLLKTANSLLFIFWSFSESSDVSMQSRFSSLGMSFILYLQWYPKSTDQGGHQFLGLLWILNIDLFGFFWLLRAAYGILVSQLPIDPSIPLRWKCKFLTTGQPGKSQTLTSLFQSVLRISWSSFRYPFIAALTPTWWEQCFLSNNSYPFNPIFIV